MFGLRRNQTGGAGTLAHLQEGPTAKKKVPARGAGKAVGLFPRLQSDNSWGGVRWCGPRARSARRTGGEQQADCFHSTSENSNRGDAECASCGCGFLVHSLTPY